MSSIFTRVAAVGAISLFLMIKGFAADAAYYLVDAQGYVAVLESESGQIRRTEIRIDRLPCADAEQLRRGIACFDKAEVAAALENFDF